MNKVVSGYSYLNYWIENIFIMFLFLVLELVLLPISYFKGWYNIIKNSMTTSNYIFNITIYAIGGIAILMFLAFRDLGDLYYILKQHEGCRYGKED